MEIAKNTTKLTKKMLCSFQAFEAFKKSWIIALCTLGVILLSFGIQNGTIYLRSIPFLVIGCAVYPLYILALVIIFAKQNKNFQPTTVDYIFQEDKVLISGQAGLQQEKTEVYYSQIFNLRQTKKFIFVYINNVSALVVDKSGFTSGSADKVVELLKLRIQQAKALKNTKPSK